MKFKISTGHEIDLQFNTDMKIDYENMGEGVEIKFISILDDVEVYGTYKNT